MNIVTAPIPHYRSDRGKTKYAFAKLAVGSSKGLKVKARLETVRAAIRRYCATHEGERFIARDIGAGYTVVWRTK